MGQQPWKAQRIDQGKNLVTRDIKLAIPAEPDEERQAYIEGLKAEIASGKYRLSAEDLAAKLMRRIRWW